MAIKTFTTGEVLTASDTNTYLANSGLVYITSQTVGSGGVSINSCFNSTYTGYRIVFGGMLTTNTSGVNMRFRTGSTDSTTGYYVGGLYRLYASGGGDNPQANGGFFSMMTTNASIPCTAFTDIWNPATTAYTTYVSSAANFDAFQIVGGVHQVATSYDGLTVYPSTNPFSAGTVTIFGYRKA